MKNIIFAALASLVMVAQAHAVPIFGTGATSNLGISSTTPAGETINVGDTFSVAQTSFGTGTGDLALVPSMTPIVVAPFTASVGQPWSFTSAFGVFFGQITMATRSGTVQSRVVDYFATGTFTPAGVFGSYAPGAKSVTGSLTQTGGPGAAISLSWTMASERTPAPEPGSLALLGLGLVGLGLVRRRAA